MTKRKVTSKELSQTKIKRRWILFKMKKFIKSCYFESIRDRI